MNVMCIHLYIDNQYGQIVRAKLLYIVTCIFLSKNCVFRQKDVTLL